MQHPLGIAFAFSLGLAFVLAFDMSGMEGLEGMGGMGGMPRPDTKTKVPAVKADIPFIRCGVCEAMVKQSVKAVKGLQAAATPAQKMTEAAIMDSLEKMCDPDREAGEWITHQDLQEEGKQLKLVDMGQPGECGSECRTIARACEQVLETLDLSEMSEMLWKGTKRAALTQAACYDSGRACRKKAPPLPVERAPGPAFKALDEEKAGHAKLMRSMKEAGLKGTMYNKDNMMDMMAGASDDGEEEQEL
ncbi:hypothetical protein V8C86DRAFT_2513742 [Haematococcus lacustris]